FATSVAARGLARRCKDEGYLRIVGTRSHGKSEQELCVITEKGLAFVLNQLGPRQILEDLVRALEARQGQVEELVTTARQWQISLDTLHSTIARVLEQIQKPDGNGVPGPFPSTNGADYWKAEVLAHLAHWQAAGAMAD